MAPTQRSLLTAVVLLVAAELVMSAPQGPNPPPGSCRDDMCINDYRGRGTDVDLCDPKARLVKYCPALDELCLAAPCKEKKQCLDQGGFCVSDEADCTGRTIPGLCEGHGCSCCIIEDPEWPTEYIEPSVSVCSGSVSLNVNDVVGVYSPNFPRNYNHDTTCSLDVVSSELVLLKIEFLYFDLDDCEFDSLSISSGSHMLSGSSLPETIFELSTTTTLTFQTDSCVSHSGFYIKLTAIPVFDVCDGDISVTNQGALISPNHPSSYPANTDCSAVITSPTGTHLNFDWLSFDLEGPEVSCWWDYVKIYDTNSPSTYLHCGTAVPFFTMSTTNEVKVDFKCDVIIHYSGFLVYFTVV